MKAFYLISYGGSDAAKYGDLPDPVVGNDQLLIQVKAASINPVDFKIKRGDLKMIVGSKFPKIVGSDFAGIIKEAGPEIKNFKAGDSWLAFIASKAFTAITAVMPAGAMVRGHSIPQCNLTLLPAQRQTATKIKSHCFQSPH